MLKPMIRQIPGTERIFQFDRASLNPRAASRDLWDAGTIKVESPDPEPLFDEYLVILAKAGSGRAFEKLVRRWTPRLLSFTARSLGRTDLARDVVQETWVAAVRGLRALQDPATFPAWIYRVAQRKCVDAIRMNQRSRRLADEVRWQTGSEPTSDESGQCAERDLIAAIAALGQEHREAVNLFYREELGVEEIAAVLGVPVGTVKSRLFHARGILKRLLGE